MVNVKFDLRGREYNGQYYVDLNAGVERGDQTAVPTPVPDSNRCGQCGSDAPVPPCRRLRRLTTTTSRSDLA